MGFLRKRVSFIQTPHCSKAEPNARLTFQVVSSPLAFAARRNPWVALSPFIPSFHRPWGSQDRRWDHCKRRCG